MKQTKKMFSVVLWAMACCLLAMPQVWAGDEVIYEPFADSDTTLTGNTPGTGLSGTWSGDSRYTNVANQTYGTLPTSGNGIGVYYGWANIEVGIASSAAYSNLLENGSAMWFSILYKPVAWNNYTAYARFAFAMGDDGFSSNGDLGTAAAQAIGFGMGKAQLYAGLWTNSNWGANNLSGAPATAVDPNQYETLSINTMYLIVGHVQWGANDATDDDVVTLYTPDSSLNLGSAVAQSSGIVSQDSFNLIAMHNGNEMTSIIDEIRFGPTYDSVIGVIDATAPEIDTLSPTNNAVDVLLNTNLVATFTENITANTGNVVLTNITAGSSESIPIDDGQITVSGTTLTIDPTASLSVGATYAILIDSDAVQDVVGNAFAGISATNVWSFSTIASDIIAPDISSLSPTNGATDVLVGANLVATFNELIQTNAGNVVITNLTDGTNTSIAMGDGQISVVDETLTINPTSDLENGDVYAVLIDAGAVEDQAGTPNAFAGITDTNTWRFTVDALPAIESTDPANGASTYNYLNDLLATFNEPIYAGAGNIVLTNLTAGTSTNIPIGNAQIIVSGSELRINPSTELTRGATYAVLIDTGAIVDATGNAVGIASVNTWQFTVISEILWTPSEIEGLVWGWWDPSDSSVVLTNDAVARVSELTDLSGRGNHMRQGTAGYQPSTGTRTIGGTRNALDYNAANDQHLRRMNTAGWSNLGTNGMISIFAVFEYDSDSYGIVHFQNHLSLRRHQIYYQLGSQTLAYSGGAFDSAAIFNVNLNWDASASLPHSYINAYVNGSNQVDNTAYTTQFLADTSAYSMTFMSDNNSTVNMDGALGEVVIVMDTSDDTRERMEGYLAHKWGLTDNLPPGHRYKSTAPSVFQPGSGSIFRFR